MSGSGRVGDALLWQPAHSLNFGREHGGDKGEAWRRMFMSDSATAFAALALLASADATTDRPRVSRHAPARNPHPD